MTDPSGRQQHAVILSGGGANGAYEVGILKALFSGRCASIGRLVPDFFFGTSIGSYNAAFLVSQWDEFGPASIANLERTWIERLAADETGRNGTYRFRGDPVYFLNPSSYLPNPLRPFWELTGDTASITWEAIQRAVYLGTPSSESVRERIANLFDFSVFISTEPWHQSIRDTINFAAIRHCDTKKLRIFGTNWATGQLRIFENHDMTDNLGALAILASSAVPGIFPPVDVGAEPFVDGGVLMNTPLRPALDEGADCLHVIYLDPEVAAIPISDLESTVAATYRLQTISWAALVNREIARARRINRGLAALDRVRRGETIEASQLEELVKGAVMILGGQHRSTYRPITIHRYHPREELGSGALGMLNMERDHLEDLIQRGFADASQHDCERECCVIPGKDYPACARDERS